MAVCVIDRSTAGPQPDPRASLTEPHKKWEKNNIVVELCPTFGLLLLRSLRGRETHREREKSKPDEGGGGGEDEITPVLVAD